MSVISEEARFLFDLQGFIVLRGVLSEQECAALLSGVQSAEEKEYDESWMDRLPEGTRALRTRQNETPHQVRLNGLPQLSPVFDSLIAHPTVIPYLEAFVGDPQLINTWSISKSNGTGQGGWHRGVPTSDYSYDRRLIRTRMLNTVWFLTENGSQDGSVMALPGSHKSNMDITWSDFHGLDLPGSAPVLGRAGDVLLFSEAVLHTGMDKTTEGIRSNLYYNYVHAHYHVAMREPGNVRHFHFPDAVRNRFDADQLNMTRWMEFTNCP